MNILAFDCSSKTMAAAVSKDGVLLAKAYSEENRNHAPYLMPMIHQVLTEALLSINEIHAIAVTVGPGSFTGLRIGIATAKGFSDTLQIPMIPLFSLDALVEGFSREKSLLVPMLDARKNQVYAAIYDNTGGEMIKVLSETPLHPITNLQPILEAYDSFYVVGDAVPGWKEALTEAYGSRCRFLDDVPQGIQGESLIALGEKAHSWNIVKDVTPFYLRGVDAKAKFLQCQIISLEEAHIDDLLEVEKTAFSHPWTKKMFLDERKNGFAHYYVAFVGDKLVGYGGFWLIEKECHITNIAVHGDYRHLGLGTLLVERLLMNARSMGAEAATLEVRPSNEKAITLYEKFGFKKSGVRPHYYEDNNEDALIMWLAFSLDDTNEKPWSLT